MGERRLFFALWPDDPVRQGLFHWQTHNLPGDVRWQHRADLHMTLHFLGMVDNARLPDLVAAGDAAIAATAGRPLTLVLDRVGHWPAPRVLWAAPASVPGGLLQLQELLGDSLRGAGFTTEERAYRPHVTLARKVRDADDFGPLMPLTWTVREMALVESCPGDAPVYHPLHRWSLDFAAA